MTDKTSLLRTTRLWPVTRPLSKHNFKRMTNSWKFSLSRLSKTVKANADKKKISAFGFTACSNSWLKIRLSTKEPMKTTIKLKKRDLMKNNGLNMSLNSTKLKRPRLRTYAKRKAKPKKDSMQLFATSNRCAYSTKTVRTKFLLQRLSATLLSKMSFSSKRLKRGKIT